MEDITTLVKSLVEIGLGPAAFVVLIYAGLQIGKFGANFVNNHWEHFQTTMDAIATGIGKMNDTIDKLNQKLDSLNK